jgi:hypothetical protein
LRILIIGGAHMPETAAWLDKIADQGWDIHLFPPYDGEPLPTLRNLTLYRFARVRNPGLPGSVRLRGFWPIVPGSRLLPRVIGRLIPRWGTRVVALALLIRWLRPDIVHSLGIVDSGYLTVQAKDILQRRFPEWQFPRWIASDPSHHLDTYGGTPDQGPMIRHVLASCDDFQTDEPDGAELASALGFTGTIHSPTEPQTAVSAELLHPEQVRLTRQPGCTSARRVIALNGHQDWAGRALVGLRALERCADALQGYRVGIYFPGISPHTQEDVRLAARLFSTSTGIPVDFEFPSVWPSDSALWLQGGARIAIALSLDDSTLLSLPQAMYMGAFPIYSNTGCAGDWVRDGETGFLVQPEDPESVEAAIRKALADDSLVDRAGEENMRAINDRLEIRSDNQPNVGLYRQVASEI